MEQKQQEDLRDRLTRAEQDIKNHKENFAMFKSDDFGALKREVHSMRGEFNEKLDRLLEMFGDFKSKQDEKISQINLTMAKWSGAAMVMFFIIQLVIEKIVK
jgi:predicted nuclease with TOPRIM domain